MAGAQVQPPGPHLALILFRASLLIAGRNDGEHPPVLARALRGTEREPKERERRVLIVEPRRLPSLQYTIFVLSGCSPARPRPSCPASAAALGGPGVR